MATSEHTPPASADASASAHPPADTGRAARVGLWALGLGFGGFLLWAGLAPLDEGVPSQGTVMIDTKRKTVQHLSGGIIRQVMVHEGQHVQEGQPLLELDAATMRANFESVRQRYLSLRAMQGRLQAEQADKDSISFHPDLQEAKVDPLIQVQMQTQSQLLQTRRFALRAALQAIEESIQSQQAMLQTYDAMLTQRRSQLALVQEELGNTRSLVAEGYAPRNRQLELERQLADIQTAIVELLGNTQRAQRAVAELRQQSQVRRQEYRKEVETQLAEKKVEVTFTDALRKHLAKKGFDPLMGARPMQRLIQDTIRRALADELLFGRLTEGGRLTVDIDVKTDDKGVETSEVRLDIQPLPKKERSAKSEPAEPEEATTD